MILLRRRHRLDPLDVTTSPAPVLGGPHVDVAVVDEVAAAFADKPIDVTTADGLELVDGRPAIDSGRCYHHLHFEFDGRRFGALVHEHQHSASLLPCPYVGRAGR